MLDGEEGGTKDEGTGSRSNLLAKDSEEGAKDEGVGSKSLSTSVV